MQQLLVTVFLSLPLVLLISSGKRVSTGYLRFVIFYCVVRMTCKLPCSGSDPAKHLSVRLTLSIQVPFTVM